MNYLKFIKMKKDANGNYTQFEGKNKTNQKIITCKLNNDLLSKLPVLGEVVDVNKDGNCVFASFLYCLDVSAYDPKIFRKRYVNWLLENKKNDPNIRYLKSFDNFFLIDEDLENICMILDVNLVICNKNKVPMDIRYFKYHDKYICLSMDISHFNPIVGKIPANSKESLIKFLDGETKNLPNSDILKKRKCEICKINIASFDNGQKITHYSTCLNKKLDNKCNICKTNLEDQNKELHVKTCLDIYAKYLIKENIVDDIIIEDH
jgi:hypothetical protein